MIRIESDPPSYEDLRVDIGPGADEIESGVLNVSTPLEDARSTRADVTWVIQDRYRTEVADGIVRFVPDEAYVVPTLVRKPR